MSNFWFWLLLDSQFMFIPWAHCPTWCVFFQDIQHLSPATDFYKKLALDCSGQQVAVDLFLLSAQYCDLASLGESWTEWMGDGGKMKRRKAAIWIFMFIYMSYAQNRILWPDISNPDFASNLRFIVYFLVVSFCIFHFYMKLLGDIILHVKLMEQYYDLHDRMALYLF